MSKGPWKKRDQKSKNEVGTRDTALRVINRWELAEAVVMEEGTRRSNARESSDPQELASRATTEPSGMPTKQNGW